MPRALPAEATRQRVVDALLGALTGAGEPDAKALFAAADPLLAPAAAGQAQVLFC
jgi:hypothetical protein